MHAGRLGAAAGFEGYSYALVVDSRVTLHDFGLKAKRIPAIAFVEGQWDDEINGLANPRRPLRATDRQSE